MINLLSLRFLAAKAAMQASKANLVIHFLKPNQIALGAIKELLYTGSPFFFGHEF